MRRTMVGLAGLTLGIGTLVGCGGSSSRTSSSSSQAAACHAQVQAEKAAPSSNCDTSAAFSKLQAILSACPTKAILDAELNNQGGPER